MDGNKVMVKINIRREQQDWLRSHPVINLSGLVAQIVKEERMKPKPFNYNIERKKNGNGLDRAVTVPVFLKKEDKIWLDNVRAQRNKKQFLSGYVQKRLDYIQKTGIINLTIKFQDLVSEIVTT